MINFRTTLMLTTGLAASFVASPSLGAQAQPQAQPQTDASTADNNDEAIIVTAQ